MKYNKSPISLREGHVYLDGIEVMDSLKCELKFTPDVWEGRVLGEASPSRRWRGYTLTGSITRRRSTPWLKEAIHKYISTGATPEFTIQGIMDDKNSDYYEANGSDTVTVVGCVLTGDMILTMLDSGGDVIDETITFGAKDIV
jgi:hypothetical protein